MNHVAGAPAVIDADYVIVGAGSAGCVLADRLSASGRHRVLLLEAGADDRPLRALGQFRSNLMIHIPVGYAETLKDPRVNWMYRTQPDAGTSGREHIWPRGKVLGGSSSINGMLYVRGQQADYDGWRQAGCDGWGWDDVLPYFRRAEHQARGESALHGVGGPIHVSDPTMAQPVSEAVLAACAALGLPRRDCNGSVQEGADWFQLTVRDGRRCSTAVAYLHPAMRRGNLRVETRAIATRLRFDGNRAAGVEFVRGGGRHIARAAAEVILCGGAVNSPQLLQLSGVGPAALLRDHGIAVLADRPGVGANLQDHYLVPATYRLTPGTLSVNELTRGRRLVHEVWRYLTRRTGLLTMSAAHVAIFCRSRPDLAEPDIQIHMLPATMDAQAFVARQQMALERLPGLTLAPCQLRPESRGDIHIVSPDPLVPPAIVPRYLADPLDREVIVAGLRWCRAIAAQPVLAGLVAHEIAPGATAETDEALLQHARDQGTTLYHPVGTCAMGRTADAVVDPALRVHGVAGLRVIDASVMPRIISGNTNAPTIMIAEKGSDLVLGG